MKSNPHTKHDLSVTEILDISYDLRYNHNFTKLISNARYEAWEEGFEARGKEVEKKEVEKNENVLRNVPSYQPPNYSSPVPSPRERAIAFIYNYEEIPK